MRDLEQELGRMHGTLEYIYDQLQQGPNYVGVNADIVLVDVLRDLVSIVNELQKRNDPLSAEKAEANPTVLKGMYTPQSWSTSEQKGDDNGSRSE